MLFLVYDNKVLYPQISVTSSRTRARTEKHACLNRGVTSSDLFVRFLSLTSAFVCVFLCVCVCQKLWECVFAKTFQVSVIWSSGDDTRSLYSTLQPLSDPRLCLNNSLA